MKKSKINIEVGVDENHIPEQINWKAEANGVDAEGKAMFLSVWDQKDLNTLSLNLWTKEMSTDEMKKFYHQTLVNITESFERAVPDESEMVGDMYATCNYFAEKMGLISEEQVDRMIDEANRKLDDDIDLTSMTKND